MKEAYVKFETAQCLKQKRFDWECLARYDKPIFSNNVSIFTEENAIDWNTYYYSSDYKCSAPTQQMACRWLREEHNICISIIPCEIGAGVLDYTYCIYEIQADDYYFKPICQSRIEPVAYTCDYEGTIEAALKYVLTNLI